MKTIYKFNLNYPYSIIEGVFTAYPQVIDYLINSQMIINFGEIDGKHSEVIEAMKPYMFEKISDIPEVVNMFEKYNMETGVNPLREYYNKDWTIEEKIKKELCWN